MRIWQTGTHIQTRATIIIISLPGGIRRFKKYRSCVGIVADDEGNMTGTATRIPGQFGEIITGNHVGWNVPGGSSCPVTTICKACYAIKRTGSLCNASKGCGPSKIGDQSGTIATIIPKAVNLYTKLQIRTRSYRNLKAD